MFLSAINDEQLVLTALPWSVCWSDDDSDDEHLIPLKTPLIPHRNLMLHTLTFTFTFTFYVQQSPFMAKTKSFNTAPYKVQVRLANNNICWWKPCSDRQQQQSRRTLSFSDNNPHTIQTLSEQQSERQSWETQRTWREEDTRRRYKKIQDDNYMIVDTIVYIYYFNEGYKWLLASIHVA
jgi:hypothetical protein